MKRQRAFVMGMVPVVLMLLFVLAGAIVIVGTGSLHLATAQSNGEKAFYAAEGGLAAAIDQYNQSGVLPTNPWVSSMPDPEQAFSVQAYDNSAGTVNITTFPGGPQVPPACVYIVSTGTSGGRQRRTAALIRKATGAFRVGALANSFWFGPGTTIDAFDSSLGNYPGSKVNNTDLVATNLLANPSAADLNGSSVALDTTGPVSIGGKLYVGPGGSVATMVSPLLTAQAKGNLPATVPVPTVAIPTGLPYMGDANSVTSGTVFLAPGEYGEVYIPTGVTLELQPSSTYVFRRMDISQLSGTGGCVKVTGANTKVYVRDFLDLSALDSIINTTLNAKNFEIQYAGTGQAYLAGGSQSYMTLLAPYAMVDIAGGNLYGSIVAKRIEAGPQGAIPASFHYDVSLGSLGGGGLVMQVLARHAL